MSDDDCEDQGMMATDECTICQRWEGTTQIRPKLVLRSLNWCCPSCGASYGEEAKE
jgi:hypothetical protein